MSRITEKDLKNTLALLDHKLKQKNFSYQDKHGKYNLTIQSKKVASGNVYKIGKQYINTGKKDSFIPEYSSDSFWKTSKEQMIFLRGMIVALDLKLK